MTTVLTAGVDTIAEGVDRYGENADSDRVFGYSGEELGRVCGWPIGR